MSGEILFQGRRHPKCLIPMFGAQFVLLIAHIFIINLWVYNYQWIVHAIIFIAEIFYVIIPMLRWWNEIYTVSTSSVKTSWGVLYKNSREIDLSRISSISEEQGILDRIFQCGTLNFYDAAAGAQPETNKFWSKNDAKSGIRFHDTPNIKKVRLLIEETKNLSRYETE